MAAAAAAAGRRRPQTLVEQLDFRPRQFQEERLDRRQRILVLVFVFVFVGGGMIIVRAVAPHQREPRENQFSGQPQQGRIDGESRQSC